MATQGASVVISHRVVDGKQKAYEDWLSEIDPICRSAAGHIDSQFIRPIPNLTFTYTVVIRFDTIANLKSWIESDVRKRLIEKAKPLLAQGDKYAIKSGLDFLFSDDNRSAAPVRWKQFLVTWSAIYPLSLCVPFVMLPVLKTLNVADNKFMTSFFASGCIVFIMVYLLMPRYTRAIKKWLYN